jgi:hypothetical protein
MTDRKADHKALVRELRETAQTRDGAFVQANLYITAADRIEQLERELAEEKRTALEEAAKLCDDIAGGYHEREHLRFAEMKSDAEAGAMDCASAIRALVKEQPHGQ